LCISKACTQKIVVSKISDYRTMKNQTFFKPLILALAWGAWALFLAACSREEIQPASNDALVPVIDFSQDMSEADYLIALDALQNPVKGPATQGPHLQGAMMDRVFSLNYANHSLINIAGVAYDRPNDEWLAGANAGTVAISPALFAQLNAAATRSIRVIIGDNPYPWWAGFDLRNIRIVMLDQGNFVIDGLYQVSTGQYLFLGAGNPVGGQVGNTSCGAISLGRLYGGFNPALTTVTGTIDNAFIAGCSPVLIAASISFFFNGAMVP
jgi:hypothetical protein